MHWEVEQKFAVQELPAIRNRLLELGAEFGEAFHQVDQYFNHPSRDFRQTDEALRLRETGEHNFITYKGPKFDAATKTRRELELPLPIGPQYRVQFAELLSALGFVAVASVAKTREPGTLPWCGQHVELAVDEVEGIGGFVELEISATDQTLETAKAAVLSLAERLGIGPCERRSYLELLLEKRP